MVTRQSKLFFSQYFHQALFNHDLENVTLYYKENGFLDVHISDTSVAIDSAARKVSIRIAIVEGALYHVRSAGISGNSIYPDSTLLRLAAVGPGDIFRKNTIRDSLANITNLYTENGYLDARVEPVFSVDIGSHSVDVSIVIDEGAQFHLSQTIYKGLKRTKLSVVERELVLDREKPIAVSQLLRSQRQLYLTGLFQAVYIHPVPAASGDSSMKDILIELREEKAITLNMSAGYGTEEKARVRFEVTHDNIAGTARKIGCAAKLSVLQQEIEASFTDPWAFGIHLRTDVSAYVGFLEEPGYNLFRRGGKLVFGQALGDNLTLSLTTKYENADLSNIRVSAIPDTLTANVRSIMPAITYDTRDNLFNARSGVYLGWTNELAGAVFNGTNNFVRSIVSGKYFHSLRPPTVLATALEAGWIGSYGNSKEIPPNERLYTGGINSIRGFAYQSVGPIDNNGVPLGGMFKVVWNLVEIRQVIYKMVGMALFFDAGNVWANAGDFSFGSLRFSPGIGLRVNTPIGIVRSDFAINPVPQNTESWYNIGFNVGQAF